MYFVNDIRNLELFANTTGNLNREDVKTKVSALNDPELRNLTLEDDMVNHIVHLNIDPRLQKNDLTVVEDISNLNAKGKTYHLLHFASVYCNFHKPEVFPVYSEQFHDFYKTYIIEYKLRLDPAKLNTYDVFSKALNDLVQRLGLTGKMNYLHLRKFASLQCLYSSTRITTDSY